MLSHHLLSAKSKKNVKKSPQRQKKSLQQLQQSKLVPDKPAESDLQICPQCDKLYDSFDKKEHQMHSAYGHGQFELKKSSNRKYIVDYYLNFHFFLFRYKEISKLDKSFKNYLCVLIDQQMGLNLSVDDATCIVICADDKNNICGLTSIVKESGNNSKIYKYNPNNQRYNTELSTPKNRYIVSCIWVRREQRQKQLATKMLEIFRTQLLEGISISKNDMVFSSPTQDGFKFAEKYVSNSENTFLITQ